MMSSATIPPPAFPAVLDDGNSKLMDPTQFAPDTRRQAAHVAFIAREEDGKRHVMVRQDDQWDSLGIIPCRACRCCFARTVALGFQEALSRRGRRSCKASTGQQHYLQ